MQEGWLEVHTHLHFIILVNEVVDSGAVYVCTEDAFPNKRLLQLSNSFARKYSHIGLTANHLTDSIYIEHAATIVSYFLMQ